MSKCHEKTIFTIGRFSSAAILSRRGNKLAPEQVAWPTQWDEPWSNRFNTQGGSKGWTYQELFGHVKSRGYTNPRMI